MAGHGLSPPLRDYTIGTLAEELAARTSGSYDIAVGSSFGGPILLQMLAQGGRNSRRVVLLDPVLDANLTAYTEERIEAMATARSSLLSEAEMLRSNPTWEVEDAAIKRFAATCVDPDAIRGLFAVSHWACSGHFTADLPQEARRGHCSHDLLASVALRSASITIVAADPARGGIYSVDNEGRLAGLHPNISVEQASGTSHDLHREDHDYVTVRLLEITSSG